MGRETWLVGWYHHGTTFEKTTDGVTVIHLDGFSGVFRMEESIRNKMRQETVETFLSLAQWGPSNGVIEGAYLTQSDTSSCGPILVLALNDKLM